MAKLLETIKERSNGGKKQQLSRRLSWNPLLAVGLLAVMNIVKMLSANNLTHLYQEFKKATEQTLLTQAPLPGDTQSMNNSVGNEKVRGNALIPLNVLTGGDIFPIECPAPLVPIYNHVPISTNLTTLQQQQVPPTRRIPRIIHMSMKSRCAPQDLADTFEMWKRHFPYHQVYFHDDDAVDALLDGYDWHEFPHLTKLMQCVKFKGAMKVDIWRILIVYKYGGLYTDIDNRPTDQFHETSPIQVDDDAFFMSDAWNRPSQWFFAMIARHPIAYYTIFQILTNLQTLPNIAVPKLVFVTGPHALKHGYEQYINAGDSAVDKTGDNMFKEGVHVGCKGKNARKVQNTNDYMLSADLSMDQNVEFEGKNMSKKERMYAQSGVQHWTQSDQSGIFRGSCMQYLYDIDHAMIIQQHQQ